MYTLMIYDERTGRFEPARDVNGAIIRAQTYDEITDLRIEWSLRGYQTTHNYSTPRTRGRKAR
jgi:hypothetical protein